MTNVAMYTEQPILTAGIRAALAGLADLALSAAFTALDGLLENIGTLRPNVILVDATTAVTFATLTKLISLAGGVPIVLWVDAPSTEFVSQALALGVRGILRKGLPVELQLKCLRTVAVGDLWVEKAVTAQLLTSQRILLTPRERQVMGLIAQGTKNKEIAYALTLTEGTVKVYLSRLFHKVGVKDRFELALFALQNLFENGLTEPTAARVTAVEGALAMPPVCFPHLVSRRPYASSVS